MIPLNHFFPGVHGWMTPTEFEYHNKLITFFEIL